MGPARRLIYATRVRNGGATCQRDRLELCGGPTCPSGIAVDGNRVADVRVRKTRVRRTNSTVTRESNARARASIFRDVRR